VWGEPLCPAPGHGEDRPGEPVTILRCREHLLPVWERWTDGNPAFRRLLDALGAEPLMPIERRDELCRVRQLLRAYGDSGSVAAIQASLVLLLLLARVPAGMVQEAWAAALAANRRAEEVLSAALYPCPLAPAE
jgi:hypothetical protein